MTMPDDTPRAPRAFSLDDPILKDAPDDTIMAAQDASSSSQPASQPARRRAANPIPQLRGIAAADVERGFRWGSLMLSAMVSLASLAAGLWFTRFVTIALEREDWIGWVATGLMSIVAASAVVLLVKELLGFRRLSRLSRLRKVMRGLTEGDVRSERAAVKLLARHYAGRSDVKWGLQRLNEHASDVLAPGELIRLADRELLAPLDGEARRVILKSAKRVATVTALSPMMWIAMGYVLIENVRMFRAIAALYGGRPGLIGALRLGRLVVTHIIATGGLAMTDDLLGQFLGQDALRRVSRRLGEGAFNGALTARLGVAAIEVTRPAPFLDAPPVRVREIFGELMRSLRGAAADKANP